MSKKPFPWSQSRLLAQQTVQHRDHLGAGAGGLRHQPPMDGNPPEGMKKPPSRRAVRLSHFLNGKPPNNGVVQNADGA